MQELSDEELVDRLTKDTDFSVREVTGRWSGFLWTVLISIVFSVFGYFIFKDQSPLFWKIVMGVGMSGMVLCLVYSILRLFSPHFRLKLDDHIETTGIRPGESFFAFWKREGGIGNPKRLKIWFKGEEIVVSTGESKNKDRATFFEKLVVDQTEVIDHEGSIKIDMGIDQLPSFSCKNQAIQWSVVLEVETPWRAKFRIAKTVPVLPFRQNQIPADS